MIKIVKTTFLLLGLIIITQATSRATELNPNTVSKAPPPQNAPPSQQNALMDPYEAIHVYVTPYVPPTPTSSAQSDALITYAVQIAISQDIRLADAAINVSTQDGVVTLTGAVLTPEQKDVAVNVAKAVGGVRAVKSNIFVQTP